MPMTPEQLKEHLTKEFTDLKTQIAERDADLEKFGQTTEANGQKVGEIDARLKEISDELKEIQGKQEELGTKLGRPEFTGLSDENQKTIGQEWVESDEIQTMLKRGKLPEGGSTGIHEFKTFFNKDKKDLSLSPISGGGVLVTPQRLPGIYAKPDRRPLVRDLIPVTGTTNNAIEYVQETGWGGVATQLNGAVLSTATTLTVDDTNGFQAGSVIYVGDTVKTPATIASVTSATVLTLTAAIGVAKADNEAVVSRIVAPTAEGGLKPLGDIDFELKTATVKTVADGIRASRQVLADATMLQSYADGRLRYSLGLSEEYQILFGSGSGENLQGLLTNASRQTYTNAFEANGIGYIKALRHAKTLVAVAEYDATGVVLNPFDKETIDLAQATTNEFIWLTVPTGAGDVMFRLTVVESIVMPQGRAAVGAFALAAEIYDREAANVRISEHHADIFLRNQVVLLGEERITVVNYRPEAIVDVTL